MAASFITYTDHGVAESSALLATNYGDHIMHLKAMDDIDNGSFVAVGDFVAGDVWKAKKAATTDRVCLVLSVPLIYEEFSPRAQEEANFYNAEGDVMRCYVLDQYDRFALSKDAFKVPTDAAVGKYISVSGSDYKCVVSANAPQAAAFVGFIYDVASNGNFRIIVLKNA